MVKLFFEYSPDTAMQASKGLYTNFADIVHYFVKTKYILAYSFQETSVHYFNTHSRVRNSRSSVGIHLHSFKTITISVI